MKAYPRTVVCLCSMLLCSIAFLITPSSRKTTIATDYEPAVESIMAGRGLMDVHGHVITRTPPVYPLTLSAIRMTARKVGVSESLLLFAFATVCLAGASACAYDLASLVAGQQRAWLAALVFAVHPHVLFGVIEPLSETPFLPVLYGAILLFTYGLLSAPCASDSAPALTRSPHRRAWLMFLAGACSGAAMLIRPAGMFVPLIMTALVFVFGEMTSSHRLRCSMLLIAGVLLAVLPWEIFVWRHSGQFVMVSSHGVHTIRDGFAFHNKTMRQHIWMPTGAERMVEDAWNSYDTLTDYPSVARLIVHEARTNPVGLLELYSYKAIRSWYGVDSQQGRKELMNVLLLALYLVPAGIGMRRYFRSAGLGDDAGDRRAAGVVYGALILYFWAMTIVTLSIARYMVPTIAFECAFIPLGLSFGRRRAAQPAPLSAIAPWRLVTGSWHNSDSSAR